MNATIWDVTVFTKNRDRLLEGDVARAFLAAVLGRPGGGRNADRDFHGEQRRNETHASTTDPDARLYRKSPGQGAKLCFMGHLLMENRHGLVVDTELTHATGGAGCRLHRVFALREGRNSSNIHARSGAIWGIPDDLYCSSGPESLRC